MSYDYICLRQNAISKLFVDLAVNDCQPSLRGLSTTTTTSSKISPIYGSAILVRIPMKLDVFHQIGIVSEKLNFIAISKSLPNLK